MVYDVHVLYLNIVGSSQIFCGVLRKLAHTPTHTLPTHYTYTLALALALQAFCVVLHKLAQLLRPQGIDGLEMCNEEAREHG